MWRVPLVAGCYALLARLGFLLDIEPGFASSIWPAAGVGTSMLLVWGLRLWPGVLIGSWAFNWWLSGLLQDGVQQAWGVRELVALAIGGGVTLQALTSAGMGRPLLASGGVLRSVRQAVPFLVLTGPASCVLSATVGVGARWLSGSLPAEELFANWFSWWLGDSIGVLLLVPLTLLALPEARPRRWRLAMRIALPLAAVFVLIGLSHRATQESRRQLTSRAMAAIQDELRFQMAEPINQLGSLAQWLTVSPTATTTDLRELAEGLRIKLDPRKRSA